MCGKSLQISDEFLGEKKPQTNEKKNHTRNPEELGEVSMIKTFSMAEQLASPTCGAFKTSFSKPHILTPLPRFCPCELPSPSPFPSPEVLQPPTREAVQRNTPGEVTPLLSLGHWWVKGGNGGWKVALVAATCLVPSTLIWKSTSLCSPPSPNSHMKSVSIN